ncbi:hypothetical protein PaecuDRAFT_2644 [Paenibacillus curdlanolyticus YK9]|uniref:Uncharacterized protein n=1 Tax=Paenibacillus curdlanolyticus YK9 TaxID=717606 RepID=E0IAF5_9BACL|nr:hypothetical protein PaecuDRAFT_2644 [Paenibacillus curdlanolyticus YK9]
MSQKRELGGTLLAFVNQQKPFVGNVNGPSSPYLVKISHISVLTDRTAAYLANIVLKRQ